MHNQSIVCKGAIFDLDGTLIDSMGVWEKIDIRFLEKRGILLPAEYVQAVKAMSFIDAAEYTISFFALKESPEDIIREWNEMALYEYSHNIRLKPGAREYLKMLKVGNTKIALATAAATQLYEAVLKSNGIYTLFDEFATLSEVTRNKRHPDIYLLAAKKLGIAPSHCVVFEDVLAGVLGAKEAGMRVCAVYDSYSALEKPMISSLSDRYIESFEELLWEPIVER